MKRRLAGVALVAISFSLLTGCSGSGEEPEAKKADVCEKPVAEWFEQATARQVADQPLPTGYELTKTNEVKLGELEVSRTCELTLSYSDDEPIDWIVALAQAPDDSFYVFNGWANPGSGSTEDRVRAAVQDANDLQRFIEAHTKQHGKPAAQIVLSTQIDRSVTAGFSGTDETIPLHFGNTVTGYSPTAKKICVVHETGPWAQLDRSTGKVKSSTEGSCEFS